MSHDVTDAPDCGFDCCIDAHFCRVVMLSAAFLCFFSVVIDLLCFGFARKTFQRGSPLRRYEGPFISCSALHARSPSQNISCRGAVAAI